MRYRVLGQSGIEASVVAFGAWAVGGWFWGEVTTPNPSPPSGGGLDVGMNFVDTAPSLRAGAFGRGGRQGHQGPAGRGGPGHQVRTGLVGRPRRGHTTSTQSKASRCTATWAPSPSATNSSRACAVCRPTTSTSTRPTGRTPPRPSPRPWDAAGAQGGGQDPGHRREQRHASSRWTSTASPARSMPTRRGTACSTGRWTSGQLAYCDAGEHRRAGLLAAGAGPAHRQDDAGPGTSAEGDYRAEDLADVQRGEPHAHPGLPGRDPSDRRRTTARPGATRARVDARPSRSDLHAGGARNPARWTRTPAPGTSTCRPRRWRGSTRRWRGSTWNSSRAARRRAAGGRRAARLRHRACAPPGRYHATPPGGCRPSGC